MKIEDNVWIGQYCILDASNNLHIAEGVQIESHISAYTHSIHISIRLLRGYCMTYNNRVD